MSKLSNLIFSKINKFSLENALKLSEETLTYKNLNFKSLKFASLINKLKKKDNETIAIFGQRNFSSYIGILSSLYSGCCYTPLNSKQKKSFIKNVIEDSQVKIFLTNSENFLTLKDLLLSINNYSDFSIILTDEKFFYKNGIKKINHFDDLTILDKPNLIKDSDLIYILYTSGSTGKPKGVEISHLNLYSWIINMAMEYDINKSDNISQNYDLTFDLSVSDTFLAWSNGATLCILGKDEQMMPSDYIIREKISIWGSTPTIATFLKNVGVLKKNVFPKIRLSFFCGEALTQDTADSWQEACPNSIIENFYGPTEATIWVSKYTYKESDKKRVFLNSIIPIGLPFHDHEFKLIDSNDKLLFEGNQGEIVYKGPQVSRGYKNNVSQNDKAFTIFDWDKTNSIWYKSGDLGLINSDGFFEFIGRKDSQIKLGGRRVEINEIEFNLLKSEYIKNIIVVPKRDKNYLCKFLIAFTTSKLNKEEIDKIKKIFIEHVDTIFFPKEFNYIEKFPLNSSGKTNRKLLEEKVNN